MTWYASQIFLEPKSAVRQAIEASEHLANHCFWLRDLPRKRYSAHRDDATLGRDGLLVIREVCGAHGQPRQDWEEVEYHKRHGNPVLNWSKLKGPSAIPIITPERLPICVFGGLNLKEGPGYAPPLSLLRYLKHLSAATASNICYFHRMSRSNQGVNHEFAWTFGSKESVIVQEISRAMVYETSGSGAVPTRRYAGTILRWSLSLFGVKFDLSNWVVNFAPHWRGFDWDQYRWPA